MSGIHFSEESITNVVPHSADFFDCTKAHGTHIEIKGIDFISSGSSIVILSSYKNYTKASQSIEVRRTLYIVFCTDLTIGIEAVKNCIT